MKKTLIALLFIVALVTLLTADINKMWVTGKAEKTTDIVPAKYQTANRERAACIIILTDLDTELDFQPNVQRVGLTHDKPGEWCFYIAPGERRVDIYATGYEPLIVILREVGIPVVHSGDVFRLRLTGDKPSVRNIENVNITVNTNPSNATIYLNDQKVDDPRQILASVGKNVIRVESDGYKPIIEDIDASEHKTYFEYQLQLAMSVPVEIETKPAGATVFLSNVECGKTPAQFFYQEGEYYLKLILDNYATIEEIIEIKEPHTKKKYEMKDIRGTLTIKTSPNSIIFINDKHYPQGVDRLKLSPQLVQIKITTPKSQDIIRSVAIKEKEVLKLELIPILDTGTVGISVLPLNAQVELTGDAGEKYNSQGSKTFKEVPIGRYQLEIKADGHLTHKENFSVKKDDVIRKEILLDKGEDAEELFKRGKDYYDNKNYEEAVKYFRLAAEQGFAEAQSWIGYCCYSGKGITQNYKEAVKWYRLAVEQGHEIAQNNLGVCYYKGEGVKKNYKEAVKWYRLASEQGLAEAQSNLGHCYFFGNGASKDHKEAVKMYRLAADQGHANAQNNLGNRYYNGEGVTMSVEQAYFWYLLAAVGGDEFAIKNRDRTKDKLSSAAEKRIREEARQWQEDFEKKER